MYCSTYSTVQLLLHNISTNQLSELPTANVLRLALEALRRGTVISFHTSIFHCFWCVVTKFRLLHYYLGWWQFGEKKWNWTFRSIYLVIYCWLEFRQIERICNVSLKEYFPSLLFQDEFYTFENSTYTHHNIVQ